MPAPKNWPELMDSIEAGWRASRRSDRISLLPKLDANTHTIKLNLEVREDKPVMLEFGPTAFNWNPSSKYPGFQELNTALPLTKESSHTVWFDGLALKLRPWDPKLTPAQQLKHDFKLFRNTKSVDMRYELTLLLESVNLSPVLAESNLHRSALRNMTAEEAEKENQYFSANCGEGIVIAGPQDQASLKIICENTQPGRDASWTVILRRDNNYGEARQATTIQINHAPFIVSQLQQPTLSEEDGNIIAQWKSDDPDGAQWRFGVESVSLNFPPQAVGEAMVRGMRFRPAGEGSPITGLHPIPFRFSRKTELTVRPSRLDRRYTVHPGDTLSILRDAELTRMVTELAYPLELTYQQTPESQRKVIVSEIARALGLPAIALPINDPLAAFSPLLGTYLSKISELKERIEKLRQQHLAVRQNFVNRIAQFTLKDANYPLRKLNLDEGLSATLRGKSQGAGDIYPLPDGAMLNESQSKALVDFIAITPKAQANARKLPIGLLYSIEFASELTAVLRTPVSKEVRLLELTLSSLGATGAVQAAFDEGRTQFDASVENGQLSRLVKTRYGRIAAVWNKARHVVIYERSAVPGAQFYGEQKEEEFLGRPLLRKMEEYIEILEPLRLFEAEASAVQNKPGCLYAFHFATQRIYVNSAWGHDVTDGYEIPLFNEMDSSGFYVKPWAGPITRGGADVLTKHWHGEPQHLYFYTSTSAGTGADTDKWQALEGVDCDSAFSFGALTSDPKKFLESHQILSLTLQALANPRFSMALRPEGASNIVHGRGTEELVATVRNMQIERTQASSRLNKSFLSEDLTKAATNSAGINSLEPALQGLLQDAQKQWAMFDGGDLSKFKAHLSSLVESIFKECVGHLNSGINGLPAGEMVLPEDEAKKKIEKETAHALALLGLTRQLSIAMVDELCLQGGSAVRDLLKKLSAIKDPFAEAETVDQWLKGCYASLPVRAFVQRSRDSLNGAKTVIADIHHFCERAPEKLTVALNEVKSSIASAKSGYDSLLTLTAPDILTSAVKLYLENVSAKLGEDMKIVSELEAAIRTLKFPPQWNGMKHLRDLLTFPLTGLKLATKSFLSAVKNAAEAINQLDNHAAMLVELKKQVPAVLDALEKAVDQLEAGWADDMIKNTAQQLGAIVRSVNTLQNDLLSNSGNEFSRLLGQEALAYQALAQKIEEVLNKKEIKDINAEFSVFVSALEALNNSLTVPPLATRSPFSVSFTEYWNREFETAINDAVQGLTTALEDVSKQAITLLRNNASVVQEELERRKKELEALIESSLTTVDQWAGLALKMEEQVTKTVQQVREQFVDQATRVFDQQCREYAKTIVDAIDKTNPAVAAARPKAGPAIKLMKLLADPPQLPQLTIRTNHIECVFDDLKDQIETSPFVARLREVDSGLKELGLAIPSCQLDGNIVPAPLQGVNFSQIIRNTAIDFENFFKKFKLPDMPDGAIRVSHHIDPKTRSANIKAEVNHQFSSTESLFEISALSLDVRKPKLVATSNVDISADESTKTRTQALFSGDWILNFSGQPLVTFADARIQYSESTGFKFDIDPKNIEPHSALKFIGDVLRGFTPDFPPSVEIVKNTAGIPTGAAISQKQEMGPIDYGSVSLGKTVLASGFRLNMKDGQMQIETYFGMGEKSAPVSMQIGVYGGGGWLTTGASTEYKAGGLKPAYEASIGIALGSTKTFNLANVAQASYAIRLFVEANFSSEVTHNFFAAGVQMTGSARVLGYLSAYLNLLLQVEHRNGQMKGRGHLDISIEVCWCYTAHISRTVEQDL